MNGHGHEFGHRHEFGHEHGRKPQDGQRPSDTFVCPSLVRNNLARVSTKASISVVYLISQSKYCQDLYRDSRCAHLWRIFSGIIFSFSFNTLDKGPRVSQDKGFVNVYIYNHFILRVQTSTLRLWSIFI